MRNRVMCGDSQSAIGTLRSAVNTWRRRLGWSRETVAAEIAAAHRRIGAEQATGIRFEDGGDTYASQHAHAERIFRWLDDESKDTNLMTANFVPSVLAALPMDLRIMVADDLLAGAGLRCEPVTTGDQVFEPAVALRRVMKEGAEAAAAIADIVECCDAPTLLRARQEIAESIAEQQGTKAAIEAQLAAISTVITLAGNE